MKKDNINFAGTSHSSYLLDGYTEYTPIFEAAIAEINTALKDYPNFDGVDFCDVGANGIQIRGHHKQIGGYTYGYQFTIKEDLSDIAEKTQEFIDMWKVEDTPAKVSKFNEFISFGEKYGWD